MIRSVAATLIALAAMGGLAMPVHADLISGTLSGDSTLTPTATPGVFAQNFTGDGDDAIFGLFTVQSQSTIDFSSPPAIFISSGSFLEDLSQGNLLAPAPQRDRQRTGNCDSYARLRDHVWNRAFHGGHGGSHGYDHEHWRDNGIGQRVLRWVACDRPRTEFPLRSSLWRRLLRSLGDGAGRWPRLPGSTAPRVAPISNGS